MTVTLRTSASQNPASSSGYRPMEIPTLQSYASHSGLRYEAYQRAPSPFLNPDQAYGPMESTTPLSSSAPSPVFMPPQMIRAHHRHHSSVASAPVHVKKAPVHVKKEDSGV